MTLQQVLDHQVRVENGRKNGFQKGQSGNPAGRKPQGVEVDCSVCGKKSYRSPSEIVAGRIYACSNECRSSSVDIHKKISESNMGKKFSDEHKKKLSVAKKTSLFSDKHLSRNLQKHPCPDCGKLILPQSKHCQKCKCAHWTASHKEKIASLRDSNSQKMRGIMPANQSRPGRFGNVQRGWFVIEGVKMFFRSKWEANWALYLNFKIREGLIKSWKYEAKRFWFNAIKRGTTTYLPDFEITNNDGTIEYQEVKGWIDARSKTQLSRMKKYHPEIPLSLVDGKRYKAVKSQVGSMLNFFQ